MTSTDTFPYPRGSVVGILTDDEAVAAARRRLEDAGLEYEVLHGEAGLARIDVEGESHGRAGELIRKLQSVFSDDADHAREYADHLKQHHYVVGVRVGEDEAAKTLAADALRASRGGSVHYYAENYVEDL